MRKTFVVLTLLLLFCAGVALALTLRDRQTLPPETPVALELSPSPTPRPMEQTPPPTPSPTRPVLPTPSPTRPGPTPTPTPSPTRLRPMPTPTAEPSTLDKLLTAEMPTKDLYALATRLKKVEGLTARVIHEEPPSYAVGDEAPFWIGNQVRRTYFSITATLRYATPHLYMWVQDGLEIDQEALERSAQEFEEKIYPTNRRYFGTEWTPGVDSDPHLHVLNASVPGVGGYFSSADEHPRTIDPFSNEREMFYINLDVYRPGTEGYHAVLAHEFQHMIHWYQDPNEDTWVNEGASELAPKLNGYRLGGEQTAFANSPDTQLNAWAEDPSRSIRHYGASYLFVAYFAQRFGADLVQDLVAAPENGIAGFDRVLREGGTGLRFDDLFQDWVISNYLDDPSLAEGRYGYEDLDVHVTPTETIETYPTHGQATVHQYAADTIVLEPGPADVTVVFTGTETVKLLPNEPHSGQYQWWSNRGDGSDATLTRSFDLTGLAEATLEAWLWYDIEEDFDYAYVEISTDGGETWDTLPSQHTTTSNPNGNNFGHGYTGRSGGGSTPEWIREEMDLTPYTGQEIALRFEYITDDAYNAPGFALDDIAIPELGTYDDAETGDGGWVARGFIRHDNQIPQRWSVQFIELGAETRVRSMALDEHQRGRLVIEGLGDQVEQAVLVISALAPVTTEVASYQYEIQPGRTPTPELASSEVTKGLTITILYDNNEYDERLETVWGFSCLVEGLEKTILFDTGGDSEMLLRNMRKLGSSPQDVDVVVISHIHEDHLGGLPGFLEENHEVTVYLPECFPESIKEATTEFGADLVEVSEPITVCDNAYSTGELGDRIKEQSLVIETAEGLVVITGCAHPGIVEIVAEAKEMRGEEVHLVMGGFHLVSASEATIAGIIEDFQELGVQKVAPCHCSGDLARSTFEEAYGENFILAGVGKGLEID